MAEKSGFRPAHDTWPEFIGKLAEGSMLGSLGLACEVFATTAIPDEHLNGVITTLRGIQEKAKEDSAAKVAGLIKKLEARQQSASEEGVEAPGAHRQSGSGPQGGN